MTRWNGSVALPSGGGGLGAGASAGGLGGGVVGADFVLSVLRLTRREHDREFLKEAGRAVRSVA